MFRDLSLRLRHRTEIDNAVRDELRYYRVRHAGRALEAALEDLNRPHVTRWGRLILRRVVAELRADLQAAGPRRRRPRVSAVGYWNPPWDVERELR